MSQQDLDPVTETLNKVLGAEDVALVTRGAAAMRNRIGTLSDSDVDRIAAAVADKMMASAQMQNVSAPEEKAQLRAKVYDVAYQLVLSVAGSGLFALLAYFADVISFSFSKEGDAGDPEKAAAREDMLASVAPEDRTALRQALDPALPQLIGMEMFKRVRQHDELLALGADGFDARSDPVKLRPSDPAAVGSNASWDFPNLRMRSSLPPQRQIFIEQPTITRMRSPSSFGLASSKKHGRAVAAPLGPPRDTLVPSRPSSRSIP